MRFFDDVLAQPAQRTLPARCQFAHVPREILNMRQASWRSIIFGGNGAMKTRSEVPRAGDGVDGTARDIPLIIGRPPETVEQRHRPTLSHVLSAASDTRSS